MKLQKFYKLALPNGFDFFTGKTINYRDNIGKTVVCPKFNARGSLCSSAFIHASRKPNDCFVGARIPCSAYLVKGKPIIEDKDKGGFGELFIIEELKPAELFDWNYAEAVNPINPFKIDPPTEITEKHIALLKKWASMGDSVWASVGDSVWASVWASVRASVGDSVWDSVWASVRASVGDSVWASVGAYIGSLFPLKRKDWKYTENIKCKGYPFQPAVDLWKMGLVPSFDGKTWRLHGGEKGRVVWEGTLPDAKEEI